MDRRRITGRELAAGAGTTEATVSRYLSGARSPENFEILARTADFLARYLRASDDDRKVLWAILDKYKAE